MQTSLNWSRRLLHPYLFGPEFYRPRQDVSRRFEIASVIAHIFDRTSDAITLDEVERITI
jgi:hypothetical protein